jgi:hypothetical protein
MAEGFRGRDSGNRPGDGRKVEKICGRFPESNPPLISTPLHSSHETFNLSGKFRHQLWQPQRDGPFLWGVDIDKGTQGFVKRAQFVRADKTGAYPGQKTVHTPLAPGQGRFDSGQATGVIERVQRLRAIFHEGHDCIPIVTGLTEQIAKKCRLDKGQIAGHADAPVLAGSQPGSQPAQRPSIWISVG